MATKDINKGVKYLNKDFKSIRNSLIDFSKIYFPEEYNDFGDSSIGMMFSEMIAYVGDSLSFYTDNQLRETFRQHAQNRDNLNNIANTMGYKVKPGSIAYTDLDVYQIVPSTGVYSEKPDLTFAMKVNDLFVSSKTNPSVIFKAVDSINFSESGSSALDISIYETDESTNSATYFLLKKNVKASSGILTERTYSIGDPEKYHKILLPEDNIVEILSIIDDDGYTWYEVPYLAQDHILIDVDTSTTTKYSGDSLTTPYLLKYKKIAKRFITRTRSDNKTEIQFGAGTSAYSDEILIPNANTIHYSNFNNPIDPRNFLNTSTYGEVPGNVVLTIKYLIGSDLDANVPVGDLVTVSNATLESITELDGSDLTLFNSTIKTSLAAVNITPSQGARGAETSDEIRNNTAAYFSAQDRCVTREDYIIRTLSMPTKYGSVSKVHVVQDDQLKNESVNKLDGNDWLSNPLALNLYCLGSDADSNLITLNNAIKENLKTYLDKYRMITDAINIKDAFIINIGVTFELITFSNVINKREVVLNAVEEVKKYFNINEWQITQPIILNELYSILDKVNGVRTVSNISIFNKYDTTGETYSRNFYDIDAATIDGIIFTSLDPSIWEIKYPNSDILGSAR